MTVCNMSIEAGARAGLIAPDETTFDYLARPAVRAQGFRRGRRALAEAAQRPGRQLRSRRGLPRRATSSRKSPGAPIPARWPTSAAGCPTRPTSPTRPTRRRPPRRLEYMGLQAGHADHRRSRSTACSSAPAPTGGSRTCGPRPPWSAAIAWPTGVAGHGRARQRPGQAPGRGRRARQDLHRRRARMARGRLQHVPGHESRQARAGPALRRRPAIATSRAGRARAAARTWSRPPWPPPPPWPAISSISANGSTSRSAVRIQSCTGRLELALPRTEHHHATLHQHTGLVLPLDRPNVDTDQIIPKQFLKRIERTGFGQFLFFDWRFRDDGSDNPEFELNRPEYAGASILLGAAELRLRLEPRARPLGAGGLRLPRADRPQLRRHLLQQLLQERHVADPARRGGGRRPVRPRRGPSGLPADGRPGEPDDHATTSGCRCPSRSTPSAATACWTAWTTSA